MRTLAILCLGMLACSGVQDEPSSPADATGEAAIEDLVLTTAVAPVTFEPAARPATSFPASTRQLYAVFRVADGELPLALRVSWHREGDGEPLSSSRLVATGYRWMAAPYEGVTRLAPGRYQVRVEAAGEVLDQAEFVIEGGEGGAAPSPTQPRVTGLRMVSDVDERGNPRGRPITVLPPGSRQAHAAFTVSHAPPGTEVTVRWVRGGQVIFTSNLGQISGTRELAATLTTGAPLAAGLYRAEVLVDGEPARSLSFTVEGAAEPGSAGPRVANLVLTTAVQPGTGRPAAPALSVVPADVGTLYLSFTFAGMPYEEILTVRWLRDDAPETPLASSAFQVAGRGSLAASFRSDDPLEPGGYRVEVVRRGAVAASVSFSVGVRREGEHGAVPGGADPGVAP